jgi:anaerobic ribonucleoside-triphosphate reductase activating protein
MIHFPVRSLGPGMRIGFWFQGCSIHCSGCVTKESWDFDESRARDLDEIIECVSRFQRSGTMTDGLTISGGEPFDQPDALMALLRQVNAMGMDDILIYTGYAAGEISRRLPELPGLASAMVGGPFEAGNLTDSTWKGSENQTFHLFREKFRGRYDPWLSGTRRALQYVRGNGGGFLIGVPRQNDVERLRGKADLLLGS